MSIVDYAAISLIMCAVAFLGGFAGVQTCWKLIRKEVFDVISSMCGDSECQSKL